VPTDEPESDGTLEWDATTIVVVEVAADGESGLGYTYADAAAGVLIESKLAPLIDAADPMTPAASFGRMRAALRNDGTVGLGAMALSAVDIALWDLKAKLLGKPLADVLPRVRETVPVYGSGGFTSYSPDRLGEQLGRWVAEGIPRVKMKVGRDPGADEERVRIAREARATRI
jgi:L-alanine-DL-glutamate epimerase-like enolase superfamily enzyme